MMPKGLRASSPRQLAAHRGQGLQHTHLVGGARTAAGEDQAGQRGFVHALHC